MKSVQLDYTSLFAKEIAPYFYDVNIDDQSDRIKKSMTILKQWDFVEGIESKGALVFHSILRRLVIEVFGDELNLLGDKYLDAFTSMKYLHNRSLRKILAEKKSSWIDDIRTKNKI